MLLDLRKVAFATFLLFFMVQVAESEENSVVNQSPGSLSFRSEKILMSALESVAESKIDKAILQLESLKTINPNFDLAKLVHADLTLSKKQRISGFWNGENKSKKALRDEMLVRWAYYKAPIDKTLVPTALVELPKGQQHVLLVDQSRQRMFVYKNSNGLPVYVDDFYISIGKEGAGKKFEGDKKTPLGVYFVTRFIDSSKLPDLYGSGAFPINYPNAWDVRRKRTGTGIWLHGTPEKSFSRPPKDSDGCVVMSNDVLTRLMDYVTIGGQKTPVILAERLKWQTKKEWKSNQNASFYKRHDQWRRDWESGDIAAYLGNYSKTFKGSGKDYKAWAKYKRRVNGGKRYIRVNVAGRSILAYPGQDRPMMVVTFSQDYSSDTYASISRKRQYWRLDIDGQWRIIFEGSV